MKTVLITGAAQGIGLAIARRFAREGWFVGLFDRNDDTCRTLAASSDFPHAIGGFCDVTQRDSVQSALETFSSATGQQLHVLVNNAGVLSAGPWIPNTLSERRSAWKRRTLPTPRSWLSQDAAPIISSGAARGFGTPSTDCCLPR